MGGPSVCVCVCVGGGGGWDPPEPQLPPQILKIYETKHPLFIEVCVFRIRYNLNKIFASDTWARMSLNELKWV